ncbi:hypothetical protein C6P40_005217 [Pichia californica]|uniref:Carboxymuconolactone decarboxylase-like domain-containing protein n=1 Tax=Pichia californica TaxID=460514 RepID=A0A9P6WLQ9_9ASCO|nr:hypothetical protein C6P42_001208 [[Candida] californica]KAG0689322.1 hypothetical protein C6P40_005217 [[Candida] californica]
MILNAQRLQKLATWEHLNDSWYLIATVTLTVCNMPQEIPKLYHYAMHTKNMNETPNIELYNKINKILEKFADIKATGKDINFNPYEDEFIGKNKDKEMMVNSIYYETSDKMRESILKTAALSGLPKAINSMMILKDNTPLILRSNNSIPNRKKIQSWEDYEEMQKRGEDYWNKVYTKISNRVTNQMSSSYPDLWNYTIENVYSPLLSFNEVLTPKETSLVVIASLVPQDVNPQLKGHLKGAINSGVPINQVRAARDLAVELGGWCDVKWKSEVAQV